ncbi:PilZ domain-containing protein [Roseibium sp. RKSG952]|uniref:PilZ domain-containing protein n=1 Tax=Roseibium sp. RKSG952 TaxID=2529384 RepID=UPI0012BC77AD|nr:PilZ domain-containing protein [Roseibium sp. RKSG952]MTH97969.1 PilZ domain-containing protein [Roseibium sp. RKSG952]
MFKRALKMTLNPAYRDNRLHPKGRARPRLGKITDLFEGYLTDCTLFDVCEGGVGLLAPETVDLPDDVLIYDDLERTIGIAHIRWRNGRQIGVRFREKPVPIRLFNTPGLRALQSGGRNRGTQGAMTSH